MTSSLNIVVFSAGGSRFAMEARHVLRMLPPGVLPPEAITIETLIGLPPCSDEARPCLVAGQTLIAVTGPVMLDRLPADRLFPVPPAVTNRISLSGIAALALQDDRLLIMIDPDRLDIVRAGALQ